MKIIERVKEKTQIRRKKRKQRKEKKKEKVKQRKEKRKENVTKKKRKDLESILHLEYVVLNLPMLFLLKHNVMHEQLGFLSPVGLKEKR